MMPYCTSEHIGRRLNGRRVLPLPVWTSCRSNVSNVSGTVRPRRPGTARSRAVAGAVMSGYVAIGRMVATRFRSHCDVRVPLLGIHATGPFLRIRSLSSCLASSYCPCRPTWVGPETEKHQDVLSSLARPASCLCGIDGAFGRRPVRRPRIVVYDATHPYRPGSCSAAGRIAGRRRRGP